MKKPAAGGGVGVPELGCSKCRYLPGGCTTCKLRRMTYEVKFVCSQINLHMAKLRCQLSMQDPTVGSSVGIFPSLAKFLETVAVLY